MNIEHVLEIPQNISLLKGSDEHTTFPKKTSGRKMSPCRTLSKYPRTIEMNCPGPKTYPQIYVLFFARRNWNRKFFFLFNNKFCKF